MLQSELHDVEQDEAQDDAHEVGRTAPVVNNKATESKKICFFIVSSMDFFNLNTLRYFSFFGRVYSTLLLSSPFKIFYFKHIIFSPLWVSSFEVLTIFFRVSQLFPA